MTVIIYSLLTSTHSVYMYVTVVDVVTSLCFARRDYPIQQYTWIPRLLHVLTTGVHHYNVGYYYLYLRTNTAMLLLLCNQLFRTWSIMA